MFYDLPHDVMLVNNEPRHEKTCLRGLRPGTTRTGLLIYKEELDA